MVQRLDPGHVLATLPQVGLPPPGGSVLSLPSGEVAAEVRRVGRSARGATYELRIVNESPETVTAYAYAVPVPAGARVWQGALVPPFSSIAVLVDVPRGLSAAAPLVAEVHAAGTRLGLGAPPNARTFPLRRWAAAALASALLVAATTTWDERHASGATTPPAMLAAVPAKLTAANLTRITDAGARLRRATPALRVDVVRAPASAQSGQSVRIDYRTPASSGNVALVDEFGKTVARTALDPRGSSVLLVPNVAAAQDLDVVIGARRGSERASANVPLFVRPAPRRSPTPRDRTKAQRSTPKLRRGQPSSPDGVGSGSAAVAANDLVAPIAAAPVQSVGQPIVARILAHPRALHVTLFASGGTPLAERDVARAAREIRFPALSTPRDLSLIATYEYGSGQESTISTLSVR